MWGAPKFTESQTLPEASYADLVRSVRLDGIAVDEPGQVGSAWDRVLAAGRLATRYFEADHLTVDVASAAGFSSKRSSSRSTTRATA